MIASPDSRPETIFYGRVRRATGLESYLVVAHIFRDTIVFYGRLRRATALKVPEMDSTPENTPGA